MSALTHESLLDAAVARVVARWPSVDPARERAIMAGWNDFRLATAYAEMSDADIAAAAKMYDGAPSYDSADNGGLAGVSPID